MTGDDLRAGRRGLMLILSSPSGAGKTTLAKRLLDVEDGIVLSVSATTRPARPGEIDGEDYFFVSEETFTQMRDQGEMLEWANVFGNFYGTPRKFVEDALQGGRDVLFDIDWQGAQQLAHAAREDVVKAFILPPSREELERRLRQRAQDSEEIVQRRMAEADSEMSHWAEYDYVVVNKDVDESERLLRSILTAERHKRERQTELAAIVKKMMGGG